MRHMGNFILGTAYGALFIGCFLIGIGSQPNALALIAMHEPWALIMFFALVAGFASAFVSWR